MSHLRKLFAVYSWSLLERIYVVVGAGLTVTGWIAAGVINNVMARRAIDEADRNRDLNGDLTEEEIFNIDRKLSHVRLMVFGIIVRSQCIFLARLKVRTVWQHGLDLVPLRWMEDDGNWKDPKGESCSLP
jgi:hypothetical protein